MRWSEAGYLSQIVLTHALRQASVSLILDVRHIRSRYEEHADVCDRSRYANAHLLRPADDRNTRRSGPFITATVALRSYGQAQMCQSALRCATRPSLIAHEVLSKSNPGKRRPTRQSLRGAAKNRTPSTRETNNQNRA